MIVKKLIIFCILFFCSQAYSQTLWTKIGTVTGMSRFYTLGNYIYYIDDAHQVMLSGDRGHEWQLLVSPTSNMVPLAVLLDSGLVNGYMYTVRPGSHGSGYSFLTTIDGGLNWHAQGGALNINLGNGDNLLREGSTLYLCGNYGIRKSEDQGMSWTVEIDGAFSQLIKHRDTLYACRYSPGTEGVSLWKKENDAWRLLLHIGEKIPYNMVRGYANLASASDALYMICNKSIWKIKGVEITKTVLSDTLYGIAFAPNGSGYAVGGSAGVIYGPGKVYATLNGNDWRLIKTFSDGFVTKVAATEQDVFVTVDRYTDMDMYRLDLMTGVSNNETISKYSLLQNFPNPFNPTTKIAFNLEAAQKVTLTVYDLQGRELKKLVNDEWKNSGRHEVMFNAKDLSSGVYLYVLKTRDYVETKKMILAK